MPLAGTSLHAACAGDSTTTSRISLVGHDLQSIGDRAVLRPEAGLQAADEHGAKPLLLLVAVLLPAARKPADSGNLC